VRALREADRSLEVAGFKNSIREADAESNLDLPGELPEGRSAE